MPSTTCEDHGWLLEDSQFDPGQLAHLGNKYLLGNGCMGYRGTLEEFGADELVGNMIAGLYDKVADSWREPVNAPNAFFVRVLHGDQPLHASQGPIRSHKQTLHIREAWHRRSTVFDCGGGGGITIAATRFLSLANKHLMAMEYCIHCGKAVDLVVETGIDTRVWDINGPHLRMQQPVLRDGVLLALAQTQELNIPLAVAESILWEGNAPGETFEPGGTLRRYHLSVDAGKSCRFWKFAAIFTGLDGEGDAADQAINACREARKTGFNALREEHIRAWEGYWREADVKIEGDPEGQFALRYSLYQLLAIAPRHNERISIPARGLSGQVYKGAVFWDTEMFMLPFFLSVLPDVARDLLMYRYHTLDGARRKAKEYGFEGAFFAWESQESGDDACSLFNVTDVFTGRPMRTYFRDKQIHVSAAVVYAIGQYLQQTGDDAFLLEGGAEIVFECARFYQSYAYYKVPSARYEFLDVVGPDEYHERVHNNAYTNRVARHAFRVAREVGEFLMAKHPGFFSELVARLKLQELWEALPALMHDTYVPQPDPETGVISQFDRYLALEDVSLPTLKTRLLNPTEYLGGGNGPAVSTRIIKQADVVLMLSLFPDDHSEQIQRANWEFYEPRTEHGSSLSACAYARVAARIGRPEEAYLHFLKTSTIDLTGKSKQYIGPQYIGGTHPAANGGAWMVAILGFAGLQAREDGLSLHPCLPDKWRALEFRVHWHGQAFTVTIRRESIEIEADSTNTENVGWLLAGHRLACAPGHRLSHAA